METTDVQARHLRAHPDEFVLYLRERENQRSSLGDAMTLAQWAFYDMDPKQAPIKYRSTKSRVCGLAWGKGTMAYRCRDCQTSESSCICLACYEHGNHKGHDVALYNSGYGGCCDCGDPLAWKAQGNCSNHGPDVKPDPLPPSVLDAAQATSDVLWRFLCDALPRGAMLAVMLADWIKDASKVSDYLRECLTAAAMRLAPVEGRNPLVAMLLKLSFSSELPKPVLDVATNLCLELMFHAPFKTYFSREFIPSLQLFSSASVLASSEERQELWLYNLATISSQFFHVEDLVLELARDRALLQTTLGVAHTLYREKLLPMGPGTWLSIDAVELPHASILQRTLADTRQLVQHGKVLKWCVYGDEGEDATGPSRDLAIYINCLRLMQGAAPAERRGESEVHVEMESEAWLNAWNIAMPTGLLSDIIATAASSLLPSSSPATTHAPASTLRAIRAALLQPLVTSALEWQHAQPPWPSGRAGGELLSYHIPLSRLLFNAVQHLLAKQPHLTLEEVLALPGHAQWLDLADGAARIWAAVGGVRAGMWRRNGERSMVGQANLYRTSYWSIGADLDLFTLQCAALTAGPNAFVPFMLSHYGPLAPLKDMSKCAPPTPAELVMIEEALWSLALVAYQRTYASQENRLRKEVVHQLALKDLSRAQLLSKLSFEYRHEADAPLDAVLHAVAEHSFGSAGATDGSRYKLKAQAWSEIECFYTFYNRQDYQLVHERYNAAMKTKRTSLLPFPRPIAPLAPYARLLHFALSAPVWRLFYAVLHLITHRLDIGAESLLEVTIYYLGTALSIGPPSSASSSPAPATTATPTNAATLAELTWRGSTAAEMLGEEISVGGEASQCMAAMLAAVLQRKELADRHEAIERLLRGANLTRLLPHKSEAELAKDEASRKKAEAAARKAAILAQFQVKQHDFEVAVHVGADEDEEDEEEQEEQVCVLCKEHAAPNRPLALLATPLRSRQLAITGATGRLVGASTDSNNVATTAGVIDGSAARQQVAHEHAALTERVKAEEGAMASALSALMPNNEPDLASFLVSFLSRDQRRALLQQAATPSALPLTHAIGRSATSTDAVVLRSCGHAMHSSCALQFLSTREHSLLDGPPTSHEDCLLDAAEGEMLCPLCRQLSSALVLLIDDTHLSLTPAAPLPPPLEALATLLTDDNSAPVAPPAPIALPQTMLPPPPPPPAAAGGERQEEQEEEEEDEDEDKVENEQQGEEAEEPPRPRRRRAPVALTRQLFRRTHEMLTRRLPASDFALAMHATSLVVQQFACHEMCTRATPPLPMSRQDRALLQQVLKSAMVHVSQCNTTHPADSQELRAQISALLHPVAPSDTSLLTADPFTVLMHWLLFCAPRPFAGALSGRVAMLHLASVMQALLLVAYARGVPAAPKSDAPLNFASLTTLYTSIATHAGLTVPVVPQAELSEHVERMCRPFVVRVRLLYDLLFPNTEVMPANATAPYADVLRSLRLPDTATLLAHVSASAQLVRIACMWVPATVASSLASLAVVGGALTHAMEWRPQPVRLVALPENFQELFHRFKDWKCTSCNTSALDTALCLHCSTLLCVGPQLSCCRDSHGLGEVFRHALDCSAGLGLFLLARQSGILMLAARRSALWGSLYLDAHGEPDLLFKRGKPLLLNATLMERLLATLAEHKQEETMFRSNVPNIMRGQPAIVTTRW